MVNEHRMTELLSDFARTLATDFPIQAIVDRLVELVVEILPVTAAGVTLIADGQAPRYIAASNRVAMRYEHLQQELEEGPCVLACSTGVAVSIPDLETEERFPGFVAAAIEAGLTAVFTFPLSNAEGRFGALDLYCDVVGDLDDVDMAAAQTVADVAAAYLTNYQARERERHSSDRFEYSSLHDTLTGLPNRRLLLERIRHAAERAERTHRLTALLFADLDGFKAVNDTHGHAAGDELLRAVGRRLSIPLRGGDTVARISGDEFVVVCEDLAQLDDVEALTRRVDQVFEEPFVVSAAEGPVTLQVTASIGVAFVHAEGLTADVLDQADHAMYLQKRAGGAGHRVVDLRRRATD
jgi:diguanylate cyclase (GGDEF)-like protein